MRRTVDQTDAAVKGKLASPNERRDVVVEEEFGIYDSLLSMRRVRLSAGIFQYSGVRLKPKESPGWSLVASLNTDRTLRAPKLDSKGDNVQLRPHNHNYVNPQLEIK